MALFDLDRFIKAQDAWDEYATALAEVRNGYKITHWIWYVFPQMAGLGMSENSRFYGIASLLEAKAYLGNPTLSERLYEITRVLLKQKYSAVHIFGSLDAMKVQSCMTLFDAVSPDDVFGKVIEVFYDGQRCQRTLDLVSEERDYYRRNSALSRAGLWLSERAIFESGSFEASEIRDDEALATVVMMLRCGESLSRMLAWYLWHKGFSDYRLENIAGTLRGYFTDLIYGYVDRTGDRELQLALVKEEMGFVKEEHDVFAIAARFDELYSRCIRNRSFQVYVIQLTERSLI